MAISVIRRADDDDLAAVRAAAVRFCQRHDIDYDEDDESGAEDAIEYALARDVWGQTNARLRKLWTACYCRALRVPTDVRTTIAYGHVGTSID